jgi:hypothetical protein
MNAIHYDWAFPATDDCSEGLTKLEYFAIRIYVAKLAKSQSDNNADTLIRQSVIEAKKLLDAIQKD